VLTLSKKDQSGPIFLSALIHAFATVRATGNPRAKRLLCVPCRDGGVLCGGDLENSKLDDALWKELQSIQSMNVDVLIDSGHRPNCCTAKSRPISLHDASGWSPSRNPCSSRPAKQNRNSLLMRGLCQNIALSTFPHKWGITLSSSFPLRRESSRMAARRSFSGPRHSEPTRIAELRNVEKALDSRLRGNDETSPASAGMTKHHPPSRGC